MKKKVYKKIMSLLVLVIVFSVNLMSSTTVFAETVDGSELTEQMQVEKYSYGKARGEIISEGYARLSITDVGEINAYAHVLAHVDCDRLSVEVIIQKYSNGEWKDFTSADITDYNASMLSKSIKIKVDRGCFYRIKALCTAEKGDIVESQMPITDGLYVR